MMPVGDQQLRVAKLFRQRLPELRVEPPETVSTALQVRLAEPVDLDRAVPEEEERLELRAGGAEQTQATLLRSLMRAFVWQDDAALVRLGPQRRDEAFAVAGDAVRTDVLLREPPVRRLRLLHQDAPLAPGGETGGGLLLGVG